MSKVGVLIAVSHDTNLSTYKHPS